MLSLKLISTYRLCNLRSSPEGGACFIACFSNLASTSRRSPLVDCLIGTFKFTDAEALAIAARFSPLRSPQKPQALSRFFRDLGLNDAHIQSIVSGAPQILFAEIDRTLNPKIQQIQKLGFQGSRLGKFLSKNPGILTASLKQKLVPRLETLQKAASHKDLSRGVENSGWVLFRYPESRLLSNIAFLQSYGIVGSKLSMLFKVQPRIFLATESQLRDVVYRTLDFGFSVESNMFVYGLHTMNGFNDVALERKFAVFFGFGFSREECIEMLRKAPVLMRCAEGKLKFGIDFYLNTMKLTKEMICRSPALLMYNMKERVIPRYRVLEVMVSKALLKTRPNFGTVASLTDERFIEKFVFRSVDDAKELLMVYKDFVKASWRLDCQEDSPTSSGGSPRVQDVPKGLLAVFVVDNSLYSMESSKVDAVSVKFTGKNFALWEFQFRVFVQGRRLLSILDGSTKEPIESATAKVKDDWEANNAQVISWILSSIDPGIALSLRGFTSASATWKHLTDLYTQTNASRKFDIEFEIASLQQGDRDISSYYQAVVTLWTEHDLLTASLVSSAASSEVLKERASSRLMQFLMCLRPEYEGIRAPILHREVTTIEKVLPELLREETRLRSQNKLDIHTTDSAAVGAAFAVQPGRP
ncbi:Transcription termination factor MTERF5, chloroplastic [Linum grandiflorum]